MKNLPPSPPPTRALFFKKQTNWSENLSKPKSKRCVTFYSLKISGKISSGKIKISFLFFAVIMMTTTTMKTTFITTPTTNFGNNNKKVEIFKGGRQVKQEFSKFIEKPTTLSQVSKSLSLSLSSNAFYQL